MPPSLVVELIGLVLKPIQGLFSHVDDDDHSTAAPTQVNA